MCIRDSSCYAEKFEPMDGSFVTFLKRKTSERKIFAFFTFHELDKDGVKRNTAILMDRNGVIAGRYFKSHITIGEYEDGMLPGDEYPVFDTEIGRIGMLAVSYTHLNPNIIETLAVLSKNVSQDADFINGYTCLLYTSRCV